MPPPLPPASALLFLRRLWHCQWTPFGIPAYIIMCVYKPLFLEFYQMQCIWVRFPPASALLSLQRLFLFSGHRLVHLLILPSGITVLYSVLYYVCLQQLILSPSVLQKCSVCFLSAVMYVAYFCLRIYFL